MTFWTFTIKIHLIDDFIKNLKIKKSYERLNACPWNFKTMTSMVYYMTLGFNSLLIHNHQFDHPNFGGFWVKNSKIICCLKKHHIIDEGKNTQGWWPWWPSPKKAKSFTKEIIMLCHLLQFSRGGVNMRKRDHSWPWWNHGTSWALSKNNWFVSILDGSLEKSPKCNLVDNTNKTYP